MIRKKWCHVPFFAFFVAAAHAASGAPVAAEHGMVVTAQHLATKVGVDVLKKGGNAIDAAVAVGYALAVVYPAAGNLGGGGFMTIRLANGRTAFIDFREKAPLAAKPDMFLDAGGKVIEVRIDPQAITPNTTLEKIRAQASAPKKAGV